MKRFIKFRRTKLLLSLAALAATLLVAGAAVAASPPVDERQLLDQGFKALVATTPVQQDWIRGLPAGKIRAMQRTGKKYYIFPDAARNQVFVGGPKEYDAYVQLHPEHRAGDAAKTAKEGSAYRAKQESAMRSATGRDLSDPFLGVSWADLGW